MQKPWGGGMFSVCRSWEQGSRVGGQITSEVILDKEDCVDRALEAGWPHALIIQCVINEEYPGQSRPIMTLLLAVLQPDLWRGIWKQGWGLQVGGGLSITHLFTVLSSPLVLTPWKFLKMLFELISLWGTYLKLLALSYIHTYIWNIYAYNLKIKKKFTWDFGRLN